MQGDGTQGNPYIYTTWAELSQVCGEVGAYIKQGNDIDMNEEMPDGITETLMVSCAELDGNGYEIRNAYFKDTGCIELAMRFGVLKNFKLINFYDARTNSGKGGTIYYHYGNLIENLTISGYVLSDSKSAIFTPGRKKILGLSANLDGLGGRLSGDGAGYPLDIENGNIFINGGSIQSTNLKNCYVGGKIDKIWLINSTSYENSAASIIDAEVKTQFAGQYGQIAIVYNSDKISEDLTVTGDFIPVTAEQLADAAYLRSIGFPIGVD